MTEESVDLDTTDKNVQNNLDQNYQVEIRGFDDNESNRLVTESNKDLHSIKGLLINGEKSTKEMKVKSKDFEEEEVITDLRAESKEDEQEAQDIGEKVGSFFRKNKPKRYVDVDKQEKTPNPEMENSKENAGEKIEVVRSKVKINTEAIIISEDKGRRFTGNSQESRGLRNLKKVNKIRLFRTKFEGEQELKHQIYIQGKLELKEPLGVEQEPSTEHYIPLDNFNKDDYFLFKNGKTMGHKDEALLKHCEFFSKLFKLSSVLYKQFKTYLKHVDIHSFILFVLYEKIKNFDFNIKGIKEETISNFIKSIPIEVMLESLPKYIEYLITQFNKPLVEEFSENFLEDIQLDKHHILRLKNYPIYADVTCVFNKFFNFFFMKWRGNIVDKLRGEENEVTIPTLQSNYFYCLLTKIEHYFINFFPYCCGNSDDDFLIYTKTPFAFCMNCRLIICVNCFKFHKEHDYFDFANFMRYKDKNILSPKEDFLNYQKVHGTLNLGDKEKDPQYEDFITSSILGKFKTKIADFFQKGEEDESNYEKKKFFTVFDFLEIFLLEHLFKLVFPFCIENYNEINGRDEFLHTKQKVSDDLRFVKGISHTLKRIAEKLNKNIIDKKQNYNFSQMDLDEFYVGSLEEFKEHKTLKELEKKHNRTIIEELYYNKLSQELQVSKSLIVSNNSLNYELNTTNFGFIVSQANSPKQYSFRFFDNRLEIEKLKAKQDKAKNENKNIFNYKKFVSAIIGTSKLDDFNLISSNKYNVKRLMKDSYKKDAIMKMYHDEHKPNPLTSGKKFTQKNFKFSTFKNKEGTEMYEYDELFKKVLKINDLNSSLKEIKDLISLDKSSSEKAIRFQYKPGYESKYDFICMYISDFLYKLTHYGVVKHLKKATFGEKDDDE